MIQDQNEQLQLLRKQVEQLLQYQEKLHERPEDKERVHESTQTSFFNVEQPRFGILPKPTDSSPARRAPQERTEMTLTFRDMQLETIMERSQNDSLQPSILVNMQEFQDSVCDKQTDETESVGTSCGTIMEQVQRLLAQADRPENNTLKKPFERNNPLQHVQDNPVRKVTMQRVQELGISFITPAISK